MQTDPYFDSLTRVIAAWLKIVALGMVIMAVAAVAFIPALAHQPVPIKFLITGIAGLILWVIAWRLFKIALFWVAFGFFFLFRDLPLLALRRAANRIHASFQRRS
ncbi:hypothetical protein HF673_01135 [Acidithiobacillus thiooxidans]|jgi:hypothetical protein|uniref:hypothetical protein n=1 Tax=Acidithiobacillus thiooxidans TaxID=930 RepID=UPI001C07BCCE|nr:hypothetical protein [Acidithiobacillus thiooxidans]MBU2834419.1 hypothetical protein [Acidithiobacillus thiooxidans]